MIMYIYNYLGIMRGLNPQMAKRALFRVKEI